MTAPGAGPETRCRSGPADGCLGGPPDSVALIEAGATAATKWWAYLLASDIRGRAAATTETIRARAAVADAFVRMSESAHARTPAPPAGGDDSGRRFAALPASLVVNYQTMGGPDEAGWRAVAVLTDGDKTQYLVVKGTQSEWADAGSLEFHPVGRRG